jgi:hypothetical protein
MRPNKSLDAGGGSVFLNWLGSAQGALIRTAASTQPFGGFISVREVMNEVKCTLCGIVIGLPVYYFILEAVRSNIE